VHVTKLRKVGDSVMLAVPPALLDLLHLKADASVAIVVERGRLVVEAATRPRYTLAELLAASDYSQPRSDEEQDWVSGASVGKEIL
jgi:antitoxin ChpS